MKSTSFTSMMPSTCSGLSPSVDEESMTGTRSMVAKMEVAALRAREKALRRGGKADQLGAENEQRVRVRRASLLGASFGDSLDVGGDGGPVWVVRVSDELTLGRPGQKSSQRESSHYDREDNGDHFARGSTSLYDEDGAVEKGEGVCKCTACAAPSSVSGAEQRERRRADCESS